MQESVSKGLNGDRTLQVTRNYLEKGNVNSVRVVECKDCLFTFTKISDTLTVDRTTMFIHVCHQELSEMSNDRPANALVCDPFHDRLGLDIAELLQWNLLQRQGELGTWTRKSMTHVFHALHIIEVFSLIILPSCTPFRAGQQTTIITVVVHVVALEEIGHTAPSSCSSTSSSTLVTTISLGHLRFSSATRGK